MMIIQVIDNTTNYAIVHKFQMRKKTDEGLLRIKRLWVQIP